MALSMWTIVTVIAIPNLFAVGWTPLVYRRDMDTAAQPMAIKLATESLRRQDIEVLKDMNVTMTAADRATFASEGVGLSHGNVSLDQDKTYPGVIGGSLSFHIPGLDTPVSGEWTTYTPSDVVKGMGEKFLQGIAAGAPGHQVLSARDQNNVAIRHPCRFDLSTRNGWEDCCEGRWWGCPED